MVMDKEAILEKLREVLASSFEIDPARVQPGTHLFTELDLDSIDGVELAIQLQEITGRRVKAEVFKEVRTVQDVVDVVHTMLQEQ